MFCLINCLHGLAIDLTYSIVADVCLSPGHPLDLDGAVLYVEVVLQEIGRIYQHDSFKIVLYWFSLIPVF